jgi:hypothetical protein
VNKRTQPIANNPALAQPGVGQEASGKEGKMRKIIIVITFAIIAKSIIAAGEEGRKPISKHDIDVMCDFNRYSGEWNQSTGSIVRDYLDPSVLAENWIKKANAELTKLRALYLKMNASLQLFENDALRNLYDPFVINYKAKLDALTALHIAVAAGDVEGVKNAQVAINSAAQEGQRLSKDFLHALRGHIDPNELERIFRERAKAAAQAIEPDHKK